MRSIPALIISLTLTISVFAQKPSPESFFPHKVGDKWQYDYPESNPRLYIDEVTKDSLAEDSSIYIEINNSRLFGWEYRADKDNNVFYLPQRKAGNFLFYKLNADSGEIWEEKRYGNGAQMARLQGIYEAFVFGEHTVVKKISYYTSNNFSSWLETRYIAAGFGLILLTAEATPYDYVQKLVGCYIDGKYYGTLVNVEKKGSKSFSFNLDQNYPNPFNPSTTISYEIPEFSLVELKVFDMLGREISTLMNEYKSPGKYTIKFTAGDLPSGIYFYKMTANSYSKIKKMNIIK